MVSDPLTSLKPDVTFEEVEIAVGELCAVVKGTYGREKGSFIAGQVFKFSGFVSNEGSLATSKAVDNHYMIVTYWRSFDAHERSHADDVFKKKFAKLTTLCSKTKELGYDMLWQGAAGRTVAEIDTCALHEIGQNVEPTDNIAGGQFISPGVRWLFMIDSQPVLSSHSTPKGQGTSQK